MSVRASMSLALVCVATLQEPGRDLQALRDRLSRRDVAIRSILVPFEAHEVASDPSLSTWSKGWWAWERGREALRQETRTEPTAAPEVVEHGSWNGARLTHLQEFGTDRPDVLQIRPYFGAPFGFSHPYGLGLRFLERWWPEYFEFANAVTWLGRHDLRGRSCDVVACSFQPGLTAIVVWFDGSESLLAIRTLICDRTDSVPGGTDGGPGLEYVRVGDDWYRPRTRLETTEVAEHPSGIWVPVRGLLQSAPFSDDGPRIEIAIEFSDVIVNEPLEEGCFSVNPVRETLVDDRIEDRRYEVLSAGDGLTGLDRQFHANVEAIAQEDGFPAPDLTLRHHPFYRSSCGPNALLVLCALHGKHVELGEILSQVPSADEHRTTMAQLESSARQLGFHAVAVRASWETLARFGRNAILQIDDATPGEPHFVVAKVVGDRMRVAAVPAPVERIEREKFEEQWAGYALLVSKDPIDTDALAGTGRGWLAALGTALLAAGALGYWSRIRRSRRSVA